LGRGSKFFLCDGLGQSGGGLDWDGSKKMDPRTTLIRPFGILNYQIADLHNFYNLLMCGDNIQI